MAQAGRLTFSAFLRDNKRSHLGGKTIIAVGLFPMTHRKGMPTGVSRESGASVIGRKKEEKKHCVKAGNLVTSPRGGKFGHSSGNSCWQRHHAQRYSGDKQQHLHKVTYRSVQALQL